MFGSINQQIDQLRLPDTFERKAHGLLRAVERARTQFLQKGRPASSEQGQPGSTVVTGSYLDRLPAELVVEILASSEWRDLLSLRRVSHAFKDLVDAHEHVIVSKMLAPGTHIGLLSTLFSPPKARGDADGIRRPTLKYIHGLEKRHVICSELAFYLASREIGPMFSRQGGMPSLTRKEKKDPEGKRNQAISAVRRILTTQLYYVDHFLTYTRLRMDAATAILAAENPDDAPVTPEELSSTYREVQSSIISTFTDRILISTHHAMNFLVNSTRLSMSPEPPHNANDDTVALMLRCPTSLRRCLEFFMADSPLAPSRLRRQFMNNMQAERDEAESRGLSKSRSVRAKRRSSAVDRAAGKAVWSPRVGEVWFENAKVEMEKRGIRNHQPDGVYFFPECEGELLIGCPQCQVR